MADPGLKADRPNVATKAFSDMDADDWKHDQETRYVLQNDSLMQQIAESMKAHATRTGYQPTTQAFPFIKKDKTYKNKYP